MSDPTARDRAAAARKRLDPYAYNRGWNNGEERTRLSIALDILRAVAVLPARRQKKIDRARKLVAEVYQELVIDSNRDTEEG